MSQSKISLLELRFSGLSVSLTFSTGTPALFSNLSATVNRNKPESSQNTQTVRDSSQLTEKNY